MPGLVAYDHPTSISTGDKPEELVAIVHGGELFQPLDTSSSLSARLLV